MMLCFVLTPYLVVISNLLEGNGWIWTGISMVGLVMTLVAGMVLCHQLDLDKRSVFLFPLGVLVMSAIMINSMVQVIFLGQTEWRGRIYEQ
jgi:hypothetical protein